MVLIVDILNFFPFFLMFTLGKQGHCCRPGFDGCRLNFLKHTVSENTFRAHLSSNSKVVAVVDIQHFLQFKPPDFQVRMHEIGKF